MGYFCVVLVLVFLLFSKVIFAFGGLRVSGSYSAEVLIHDNIKIIQNMTSDDSGATETRMQAFVLKEEGWKKAWEIQDSCNNIEEVPQRTVIPRTLQTRCEFDGDGTYYRNAYSIKNGKKIFSYTHPDSSEPFQLIVTDGNSVESLRLIAFQSTDTYSDLEEKLEEFSTESIEESQEEEPERVGDYLGTLFYADQDQILSQVKITYNYTQPEINEVREMLIETANVYATVNDVEVISQPEKNLFLSSADVTHYFGHTEGVAPTNNFNGIEIHIKFVQYDDDANTEKDFGTLIIPIENDRFELKKSRDETHLPGHFSLE